MTSDVYLIHIITSIKKCLYDTYHYKHQEMSIEASMGGLYDTTLSKRLQ